MGLSQRQAHQGLFIVSFFALFSLVMTIISYKAIVTVLPSRLYFALAVTTVIQVVFLLLPFIKKNQLLMMVFLDAPFHLVNNFNELWDYFLSSNFYFASINGVPGVWFVLGPVLMDVVAFSVLILRAVEYRKERFENVSVLF